MIRMTALSFAALALSAFIHGQVLAGEDAHEHHNHAEHARTAGEPYPLKADPLGASLAEVDEPIVVVHEGRELRFASEENRQKFEADPDDYLADVNRRIIEQQRPTYPLSTCVVSQEPLDAMGGPIDSVYGNRLVRFCCEGCSGDFEKDPPTYHTAIEDAVIEAQKQDYPLESCVISGMALGAMGEPIDYVIGMRLVRFCCDSCVNDFEDNPAKHIDRIDASANEEDADHGNQQDEPHAGSDHGADHGHHGHDH